MQGPQREGTTAYDISSSQEQISHLRQKVQMAKVLTNLKLNIGPSAIQNFAPKTLIALLTYKKPGLEELRADIKNKENGSPYLSQNLRRKSGIFK